VYIEVKPDFHPIREGLMQLADGYRQMADLAEALAENLPTEGDDA